MKLSEAVGKITYCQNTIEKNEKTISDLSIRLHEANNDVERIQQKLNPIEQRNVSLNEQLEIEKKISGELRIFVGEQRTSYNLSMAEQSKLQKIISELTQKSEKLESSILPLKQEIFDRTSQIDALNTQLNSTICQNKEKVNELNVIIVDLEYKVTSRDQAISMQNNESLALNEKLTLIIENFKRERELIMNDTNEKLNFFKENTAQSIKHMEDNLRIAYEKIEDLKELKTSNDKEINKLSGLLEQKVNTIDKLSQEKHEIIEANKFDHQQLNAQIVNLSEKLKLSDKEAENLRSILAAKDSKLLDLRGELNLKNHSYDELVEKAETLKELKIIIEKKIADKMCLEENILNLSTELQLKTIALERAENELSRLREILQSTKIELDSQKEKIGTQTDVIKILEKRLEDDMNNYKDSIAKILHEKTESEIKSQKEIQLQLSHLDKVNRELEVVGSNLQKKIYECDELIAQKNSSINGNQYLTQLLKQTQSENLHLKWNFELTEQMLNVEKDTTSTTKKNVEKLTNELENTKGNYFQMEKEYEVVKMKLFNISNIRDQLEEERKKLISERDANTCKEDIIDSKISKVQEEIARLATFDQMMLSHFKKLSEKTKKEEQKKQKLAKKREKDIQKSLMQLEHLLDQRKKVEKEQALNAKLLKLNYQKKLADMNLKKINK